MNHEFYQGVDEKIREKIFKKLDKISELLELRRQEFKEGRKVKKIPAGEDRKIFLRVVGQVFFPLLPFDQYAKTDELKLYAEIIGAELRQRKVAQLDRENLAQKLWSPQRNDEKDQLELFK